MIDDQGIKVKLGNGDQGIIPAEVLDVYDMDNDRFFVGESILVFYKDRMSRKQKRQKSGLLELFVQYSDPNGEIYRSIKLNPMLYNIKRKFNQLCEIDALFKKDEKMLHRFKNNQVAGKRCLIEADKELLMNVECFAADELTTENMSQLMWLYLSAEEANLSFTNDKKSYLYFVVYNLIKYEHDAFDQLCYYFIRLYDSPDRYTYCMLMELGLINQNGSISDDVKNIIFDSLHFLDENGSYDIHKKDSCVRINPSILPNQNQRSEIVNINSYFGK